MLNRVLRSGKTVHAYLVSGGTAQDREELAFWLAAALNCADGDGNPCGACMSCRKTADGNHPDLHLIRPEGSAVKIGQVRALQSMAWMKPREGRRQVFVLAGADEATPEAANGLLKILEEPPPDTVFCLLAARPQTLLPTVVSRCQPLVLEPAGEPISAETGNAAREILSKWPGLDELGALREAESLAGSKAAISAAAEYLALLARDVLVMKKTGDAGLLLSYEDEDFIAGRAAEWTENGLLRALAAVERARGQLRQNANPRLVTEVLLLSLRPGAAGSIIRQ